MLDIKSFVEKRVRQYYWNDDYNCATTSLKILSEIFNIELSDQVIDSALGLHGAGEYGAQCGLVEGSLMFLGIIGRSKGIHDGNIIKCCRNFAGDFEYRHKSLLCRILRPESFHPDNPPHLCEKITCEAIVSNILFIEHYIKSKIN